MKTNKEKILTIMFVMIVAAFLNGLLSGLLAACFGYFVPPSPFVGKVAGIVIFAVLGALIGGTSGAATGWIIALIRPGRPGSAGVGAAGNLLILLFLIVIVDAARDMTPGAWAYILGQSAVGAIVGSVISVLIRSMNKTRDDLN